MAVTGKQRSGKGGRFVASAFNMVIQNVTVSESVEDGDGTTFEGGGFLEHIAGCFGCDCTLAGNWDAHHIPFLNPPNLAPGSFITNAIAYMNVADTSAYTFTQFFVVSVQTTVDVHQPVKISISGKSDGPYTEPGVNV